MAKARVGRRSVFAGLLILLVALAAGRVVLTGAHVRWPLLTGLGAAAATLAAVVVKPLVMAHVKVRTDRVEAEGQRRQRQAEMVQRVSGSAKGLPRVREVASRALLGIHAAIPLPSGADPSLSDELPTYVPRDRDEDVRAALTKMASTAGFLLLVGPPASGKTRCAAEAVRHLCGDWRMFLRSGGTTLQALVDENVPMKRTVVWLDDIHEMLDASAVGDASAPPITPQLLRRLLLPDAGPVIVIGTTWPTKRDQYQKKPEDGQPDLFADARRILDMAEQIDLDVEFSDEEWQRAVTLAAADPRLAEAVATSRDRSVTATLASKNDLINRWRHGGHIYGRAVISAAVDARRAGHPQPIPRSLLKILAPLYLTAPQRAKADPDRWLDEALAWACSPVRGDIAPMEPVSATVGLIDGYEVSDILLDHAVDDQDVGDVPDNAWQVLIANASDSQTWFRIGAAAYLAGRRDHAEAAARKATEAGHATSAFILGTLLDDRGDAAGAKAAFAAAIASGDADAAPMATFGLGVLLAGQDDVVGARDAYEAAIRSGHVEVAPKAAVNLGVLLAGQDDVVGARNAYEAAIRSGHVESAVMAAMNLGTLLAEHGDVLGARSAYELVIQSGDSDHAPKAAMNLALLLQQEGDVAGARAAYERAVASAHPDQAPKAAVNLGVLRATQGDIAGARAAYETAIASGHVDVSPKAAVNLGLMLAERGDIAGARAALETAIAFGHAEASPTAALNLGCVLAEHRDVAGAKAAFETAIASGHMGVAPLASVTLGALLAEQGDFAGARAAYERAVRSAQPDVAQIAIAGLEQLPKE